MFVIFDVMHNRINYPIFKHILGYIHGHQLQH